jgi:Ca2+-binding EF-hand superfamily protein
MKKFLIGGVAAAAIFAGGAAVADTAQPAAAGVKARHAHALKETTRADMQAHVAAAFAKLDANRDGFVTLDEINARVERREQRMEQRASHLDPSKLFDRIDSNRDGKITTAEAEAARSQHAQAKGGKPARAHATAVGGFFARADANKDGVVTRAEFETIGEQMKSRMTHAGMKRGGMAGRLFAASDSNKDSRVTLAEMQQAALARFDRRDLNHDGTISPQERQQKRQQRKAKHQG